MVMRRKTVVLVVALLVAACAEGSPPSGPPTEMSVSTRIYLQNLLNIMENNALGRHEIDWPTFRAEVVAAGGTAQTVGELMPAIRRALELLGDGHSTFYPQGGGLAVSAPALRDCSAAVTPMPPLPSDIGYVRIRSFNGTGAAAVGYAEEIRAEIQARDRPDLAGWIVDLRGNDGGNMWAMLSGVGPVLGEGKVGWFIDSDGIETSWSFRDNIVWIGETPVQSQPTAYQLISEELPYVAVLTDRRVTSSGEAIAIAFRERPRTRAFGSATCGLSTANAFFALSDGAVLSLIIAVMADRTKQTYGDELVPDEGTATAELTVQRAVDWLRAQTGGPRG
jgi:carboxyl-terminal processing protease